VRRNSLTLLLLPRICFPFCFLRFFDFSKTCRGCSWQTIVVATAPSADSLEMFFHFPQQRAAPFSKSHCLFSLALPAALDAASETFPALFTVDLPQSRPPFPLTPDRAHHLLLHSTDFATLVILIVYGKIFVGGDGTPFFFCSALRRWPLVFPEGDCLPTAVLAPAHFFAFPTPFEACADGFFCQEKTDPSSPTLPSFFTFPGSRPPFLALEFPRLFS